jgi:hypothetical protein
LPHDASASPLRGHLGGGNELANKCLVYFGLGAVGGPSFLDAARLGVGTLIGIDPDAYGEDSWRTQLATPAEQGLPKAGHLGAAAHAINPAITVRTAVGLAQDVPLRLLHRADAFVVAGDNLELPVWAGNHAAALGKRLVQGAVHGESWTCFTRTYDLTDAQAACPACSLNREEWKRLSSRYGCDPAMMRAQGLEPTRTLPHLCGAAGHLLTGEVLKALFTVKPQAPAAEELATCLLSNRIWKTAVARNPDCRCPHERWTVIERPDPPAAITLAALAREQGAPPESIVMRGERPWFLFSRCTECAREKVAQRFARPGANLGGCECGGVYKATPLAMRSQVPLADLQYCFDIPLSQLGLEPGDALGLRAGDGWTYFILGNEEGP